MTADRARIARRIARLYRVPLKFIEGKHPVAIPASKKGRRRGW